MNKKERSDFYFKMAKRANRGLPTNLPYIGSYRLLIESHLFEEDEGVGALKGNPLCLTFLFCWLMAKEKKASYV